MIDTEKRFDEKKSHLRPQKDVKKSHLHPQKDVKKSHLRPEKDVKKTSKRRTLQCSLNTIVSLSFDSNFKKIKFCLNQKEIRIIRRGNHKSFISTVILNSFELWKCLNYRDWN